MVFHTNQRNVTYPNLLINNIIIERVSHFNFLGITLSYNMTWDAHINHISKKISKAIGILYQLKHIYPQRILFTLYTNLIVSHLNYCLILWGSYINENHRLYLLQKKALRIITNSHYVHSPFRTNFQKREMFKNYRHVFGSYLEVLLQAHEQQTAALLLFI